MLMLILLPRDHPISELMLGRTSIRIADKFDVLLDDILPVVSFLRWDLIELVLSGHDAS